ncbi:hypothetical protein B0H13DRAFT_2275501 [Mycena leptocephala]|nr:hypothetical protein B0H13DRAFT_2275501 [Mycena leptocephala]
MESQPKRDEKAHLSMFEPEASGNQSNCQAHRSPPWHVLITRACRSHTSDDASAFPDPQYSVLRVHHGAESGQGLTTPLLVYCTFIAPAPLFYHTLVLHSWYQSVAMLQPLRARLPRVFSAHARSAQFERRRCRHGPDGEGVQRDLPVKTLRWQFKVCAGYAHSHSAKALSQPARCAGGRSYCMSSSRPHTPLSRPTVPSGVFWAMTWSAGTSSTSTASGLLTPRVGLGRRTPPCRAPEFRSSYPSTLPPSPDGLALFLAAARPHACLTGLIRAGTDIAGRGRRGGEGRDTTKDAATACPKLHKLITFHSPPASPPLSPRCRRSDTPHAPPHTAGARVCCGRSQPRAQAQGRAVCHTTTTRAAYPRPGLCLLHPERGFLPVSFTVVLLRSVRPQCTVHTPLGQDPSPPPSCSQLRWQEREPRRAATDGIRGGGGDDGVACLGRGGSITGKDARGGDETEAQNDTKISVACRAGSRMHIPCIFFCNSPRIDVRVT